MMSFSATVNKQSDDICIISISGYLDAHTASDMENTVHGVLHDGCRRIVVDFSHLDYISSAGLGVFMVFIESVRADGGDIKLAAMKEGVFSVFDLLGFPVLFEIFPTVSEAVKAFPASASASASASESESASESASE